MKFKRGGRSPFPEKKILRCFIFSKFRKIIWGNIFKSFCCCQKMLRDWSAKLRGELENWRKWNVAILSKSSIISLYLWKRKINSRYCFNKQSRIWSYHQSPTLTQRPFVSNTKHSRKTDCFQKYIDWLSNSCQRRNNCKGRINYWK